MSCPVYFIHCNWAWLLSLTVLIIPMALLNPIAWSLCLSASLPASLSGYISIAVVSISTLPIMVFFLHFLGTTVEPPFCKGTRKVELWCISVTYFILIMLLKTISAGTSVLRYWSISLVVSGAQFSQQHLNRDLGCR